MTRRPAALPQLSDSVQFLPGVGPRRAGLLADLGIRTILDLIEYFPARHERQESRFIENLELGMTATVIGKIAAVTSRRSRQGPTVSATLLDNTGRCNLTWFRAGWMADRIQRGSVVRATGRVTEYHQLAQLINPKLEVLGEDAAPIDESSPATLQPVYPASMALPSKTIAKLILDNLPRLLPLIQEYHDPQFLKQRTLAGRRWAVETMHRPARDSDLPAARRRIAFDELLAMQLALTIARRSLRSDAKSHVLPCSAEVDRRIRRRFGFTLTPAQDRAIRDIVTDMNRPRPMHRLLQGDVGCGKTVVALYAALVAIANGKQAAIMAPTDLLARQHFESTRRYLVDSRVRFALLTGRLTAAERKAIYAKIDAGELDLLIGTHALIQDSVRLTNLGLAVVDEQHRFGVRQRASIRGKGLDPHYLIMTATPIPRTLAMTVFGDLDITTIDEMPPGRVPIVTRVCPPSEAGSAWDFVRSRIALGEQAYVVYPLVDETDGSQLRDATTEYERLSKSEFAGMRVGLVHGRLENRKREAVMDDFVAGRVQVLVSTTVIEVGIDVPQATCMIVEHAERYGLSQLHQLRGRVGRGGARGYCFLMTQSETAQNERLAVLARTTDGFKIAEEDLRLRGPGELLGTRQHGLPDLRVADLLRDQDLLRLAQRDAAQMIRSDPALASARHAALKAMIRQKFADVVGSLSAG
ncbi:hypothetical protein B7486_16955 [cyanobacterium TDX16]|nr:hypothetical protein B7486_16955 [cyanobacterium TDX16]